MILSHAPPCSCKSKEKEKEKEKKRNINNDLAVLPSHDIHLKSSTCCSYILVTPLAMLRLQNCFSAEQILMHNFSYIKYISVNLKASHSIGFQVHMLVKPITYEYSITSRSIGFQSNSPQLEDITVHLSVKSCLLSFWFGCWPGPSVTSVSSLGSINIRQSFDQFI